MTSPTRRSFLLVAGCGLVAACTSRPTSLAAPPSAVIDAEVAAALNELYASVPGAAELARKAQGLLVIPKIRQAGLIASGSYGEGALLIGDAVVEYYSLSAFGIGLTVGAQEYSQALFFMTSQALEDFRLADGWELGVGAAVAFDQSGAAAGLNTTRINRPIYEVIYGQRGLIAGASLAGAKYSRIYR